MAVDSACFAAKDQGRNCIQVHSADDSELARRSGVMEWMASINDNLDSDRLWLRCQKISPSDKDNGEKPHYEVLLGVRDEHDEPIPTEEFVRAAEQYNYMPAVDRWVVRNVFRWMADNRRKLAKIAGLAVNLSGRSFSDGSLMNYVIEQFNESKVPPGKVFFEVTETAAIASLSNADEFIRVMKEFGCRFSLDDFGSGHSSYAYLRELPVDYVKIDGVFVKDIGDNPRDYAVVNSINEIAHFMGKKTIAERVENEKILGCLQEIGVDFVQGYGIERPCPLEELKIT